jgi:energy-converting hydrogenase A subunit R
LKRLFISDCEGPISKNDNAFELAEKFVPHGGSFFSVVSKYDDVLADLTHKAGYTAGSTLKLILPFFKAFGVTDQMMEDFSAQHIVLIADSQKTLQHVRGLTDAFIVSTSYEHYIRALCKAVDFPFQNTYCTRVCLDKFSITAKEKEVLKELAKEIADMRQIEVPKGAKGTEDLSECDQTLLQRLDEIFWTILPKMDAGKLITEVTTIGGEGKANSIRDAAKRNGAELSGVMYVGDSITDIEAFKLARENGGLAVSFNGNSYAVKNSDIAVISESSLPISEIAETFIKSGREAALEEFSPNTPFHMTWDEAPMYPLANKPPHLGKVVPKVQIVTSENMQSIIKESSDFRKKVRGVAIGKLG